MSTTALTFNPNIAGTIPNQGIMPQEKPTRQIVREEILKEKQREELEKKHDAGEISDFEYQVQKLVLNMPPYSVGTELKPKFSTTA